MSAEGGHLGWRSGSPDTILKIDHIRTSHAMFALNWLTGFRGPSNEHLWQFWLKSIQRFQRRRVKCEKLYGRTDGRRTLTHDKSSHGLWPGELKKQLRLS